MTAPLESAGACPVLISRTRELASLYSLIEESRSGQGHVVLVSGEAGIGKTRLIVEAKKKAQSHGFVILQGNCFQADASYPYAPVLDVLSAFSRSHPPLPLTNEGERLVHELTRLLPDLAFLFPSYFSASPSHTFQPSEHRHRLLDVLTQFVVSLATPHAVLVVIEDLHWCDESSLGFLLSLARHVRSLPLLCLFTYRSDERSASLRRWLTQLDRERLAQEISLAPLSRADVGAMLQAIFAASRPAPDEALNLVYTLTEGNPFFVEELLTATTAGRMLYANGAWRQNEVSEEPRRVWCLPRSIQDAVRQRTERLSSHASQALTLAAVAGRRFDFALLQQALQFDETYLLTLMKELIAAQLVVEEADDQFAFRHALIREAVYVELLARERRTLHGVVAEAIESLSASRLNQDESLTALATHFSESGIWPKAMAYERRAGDKALSLYAPRAASEHFTRALGAAQQLRLSPPAQVYYARGQAYAALGDFERARDDYERAIAAAGDERDGALQWQSTIALGFLWAGRDYTLAGSWFQRASTLAEQLSDPSLRARSLNRMGNWLANTGRAEEGLRAHQESLQLFEGMQDAQGMAETHDLLGAAFGLVGDQVSAAQQLGEAITLFRMLDDRQSLMSSLAMRAIQSCPLASITGCCALRSRDECIHDAEESLRLAREIESPSGQAFAEMAMARTLTSFGEFGPALTHAREGARVALAIEHHQWLAASSLSTADIYFLLLATDQARSACETGLSLARDLRSSNWITLLSAHLALTCLLEHDLSEADAILSGVLPREQLPRNNAERYVTWAWGELALAQGEPEAALELAERLLATAPGTRAGEPVQHIPHLLRLKGEAYMALGRLQEALEALEGAKRGAIIREVRPVLWTIRRSLGRLYHLLHREEEVRNECAAARLLIEELAVTLDDATLREQFVRSALSSLPHEKRLSTREASKRTFDGLTVRERQVAILIAQGKTSRDIAEHLVVSERTAEVHVSNILGKLGFHSRAQIAVWAVEKGLTQR